jgi:prepilin-type processing-associated H-X9-DG protein
MQCANHLKQWSLACHNFHDSNDRFPSNGDDPVWMSYQKKGGGNLSACNQYGFKTLLLPYVEQSTKYEELQAGLQWASSLEPADYEPTKDAQYRGIAAPWRGDYVDNTVHGKKTSPFGEWFSILGCPSDGRSAKKDGVVNPSNYVGCTSDVAMGSNWGENRNNRGVFRAYKNKETNNINGPMTLAVMSDGTSNTMGISETCVGTGNSDRTVKGTVVYNVANLHKLAPKLCSDVRGENNSVNRTTILNREKGSRWGDSHSPFGMYHASLPPNSPSCSEPNDSGKEEDAMHISASSYHSGGVNVGMCDGSVKFVSDSVNCGDTNRKLGAELGNDKDGHQWTGASTFGVWGGAATPAGGESSSL